MSKYSYRFFALVIFLSLYSMELSAQATYMNLSSDLIAAVRNNENPEQLLHQLAEADPDSLAKVLDHDDARKTFWVNVYNAFVQLSLTDEPSLYENKSAFFKTPRVPIAQQILSFDEIEHGIIRRSKAKFGLGIFPKLFPSKLEKKFRVDKTDPRIHFALNCGAQSCPPIGIYRYERINEQLDLSTRKLLKETSSYDVTKNSVAVIALFSWFRGDWGSKRKVRAFLKKYQVIPQDSKPAIKYTKYRWDLYINNYIDL